jgi:hypothetical protein
MANRDTNPKSLKGEEEKDQLVVDITKLLDEYVSENADELNEAAEEFNDGEYGTSPDITLVDEVKDLETEKSTITVSELPPIGYSPSNINSPTTKGPFKNPLNDFASYNYIITMGCLTSAELNSPDTTYRTRGMEHIICRSSGGAGQAKVLTAFEREGKKIEFYIDNLDMKQIIHPNPRSRGTNATSLTFDIIEPFSMGLFVQAMQICAREAGHRNFIEAPYVLQIEFVGWDSDGNSYRPAKTTRLFPFKWVSGEFEVTSSGSQYSMKGVPYNEQAFSDSAQTIPVDIEILGRTLNELIQTGVGSLASVINTHLLENRAQTSGVEPDEYVFVFPKDRSSLSTAISNVGDGEDRATGTEHPQYGYASGDLRNVNLQESIDSIREGRFIDSDNQQVYEDYLNDQLGYILRRSNLGEAIKRFNENDINVNAIGKSELEINDPLGPGAIPFGQASFSYDEANGLLKRDNITIDPKRRSIRFKKGEKIQKILEELVLISTYGENADPEKQADSNGFVDWFRIEANLYNINNPSQEAQTGRPPRVIVFRIVPWKAHKSIFAPPNSPIGGYENVERQIAREYNYMYTGKNIDVLDFSLAFKNAFFQAISPTANRNQESIGLGANASLNASENSATELELSDAPGNLQGDGNVMRNKIAGGETVTGGALSETAKIQIARQFQDALINSNVDLVSTTMTIWGDPYYLSDSGMGNYTAREGDSINMTADTTMDYQSGQVDIKLNFRTPVDIRENGMYDFGDNVLVDTFSGLYMVNTLTSIFSGGKFTQELNMIRRPNQKLRDEATDETQSRTERSKRLKERRNELKEAGFTEEEIASTLRIDKDLDGNITAGELGAAIARDKELYQARVKRQNLAKAGIRTTQDGRVVGGL